MYSKIKCDFDEFWSCLAQKLSSEEISNTDQFWLRRFQKKRNECRYELLVKVFGF